MKKLITIATFLAMSFPAHAQQADAGLSYEKIGELIAILCDRGTYGYRAEMMDLCPKIIKKLQPQIDAEKKAAAEKKDDSK